MKKFNRIIAISSITLIMMFFVYNIVRETNSTSKSNKENTPKAQAVNKSVTRIRKEELIKFTKGTKSFITEPVKVEKNNTIGKMFLIMTGENLASNVHLTIYQDDKAIFDKTYFDSDGGFIMTYKITKEESTFKVKADCTAKLQGEDELNVDLIWFVNTTPLDD